jgi:cell division protein FtsB
MKKIFKDKRVIVAALVVILVFLLMDFNQRMVLLSRLRGHEKQLIQKYAELETTLTALETELAYAGSDEAVEQWAREEAGMIQEGDIPIVLLAPPGPIATEPAPPTSVIEEVNKWEIWQELFFGN